jgi:hypothetical protein
MILGIPFRSAVHLIFWEIVLFKNAKKWILTMMGIFWVGSGIISAL